MSQSQFDPALFLDAQVNEVNTRRPPLPATNPASTDGFYTAVVGEVKTDTGTIEKGDRAGQPWLAMIVPLTIEVPQQVQDQLGIKLERGTVTLTDRVFIDLTPQKTIDNSPGRNRRQRQYREALNLNKPGDVWSWRKAQGQPVKVQVEHEMYQGDVQERVGVLLKR